MSHFAPGASPIRCEPWDIGTGVTGYAWHAPEPRGAVLFQHGWGDYTQRHVRHASRLIPHLLNQGFSVFGFDMWGNGHSPGKRGLVDVDEAVSDHLAARRKLGEQPLPVYLMGHSLGGLVAATSMIRDPDGISGVVLLAPALKYDVGPALRLLARVGGLLVPTLPVPLEDGGATTRDEAALRRFESDPLMTTTGLSWRTAAGGATVSHRNWRSYHQVTVPVLAVHGTADGSTAPEGSSELIERLASADKELLVVDGGYHALLDDTGADDTLRRVLHWLDARAGT